jgi:hypothetical protein
MNTHVNKTQENKSQSAAEAVYQNRSGGESNFHFEDNRTEAITQRKLQEMADNSSRAMQLKVFQETSDKQMKTKQPHMQQVIQARFYHPLPDDGDRWNNLLDEIDALHGNKPLPNKIDIDNFITTTEAEWNGSDGHSESVIHFNAFVTLKYKVKTGLEAGKIDTNDARNVGWDAILPIIRRIRDAGYCTVNIHENVPYDGSNGVTWRVDEGGNFQRGGWKYNAMIQNNLGGALAQVRTAIGFHNDAIDREILRDTWS